MTSPQDTKIKKPKINFHVTAIILIMAFWKLQLLLI